MATEAIISDGFSLAHFCGYVAVFPLYEVALRPFSPFHLFPRGAFIV
jgi:hypothetical protein